MRMIDRTGQVYGRLVVVERSNVGKPGRVYWRCHCECGATTDVLTDALAGGRTRSCGCLRTDELVARSVTHGASVRFKKSAEYRAWLHAKGRCYNRNDKKYPLYGGRGIVMDEAWLNNPTRFLADMGPRPKGCSIDRIDNDGPYAPGNCRWATPREQGSNTRTNRRVCLKGKAMTLKAAAAELGLDYRQVHKKLKQHARTPQQLVDELSTSHP